jgi:hypothetical protein
MSIARCPMCQCEDFYRTHSTFHHLCLWVGWFRMARVSYLVCLGCGFIAPCVGQDKLKIMRRKAGKRRMKSGETRGKEAWVEV